MANWSLVNFVNLRQQKDLFINILTPGYSVIVLFLKQAKDASLVLLGITTIYSSILDICYIHSTYNNKINIWHCIIHVPSNLTTLVSFYGIIDLEEKNMLVIHVFIIVFIMLFCYYLWFCLLLNKAKMCWVHVSIPHQTCLSNLPFLVSCLLHVLVVVVCAIAYNLTELVVVF